MKRNARRLWSVLLALVMLMSLLGGTMLTARAQEETITVYLDVQDSGWEQGWVYWWDSAETVDWPGLQMICDENGFFFAQIPADAYGVVFNDGNGNQSPDLYEPKDGYLYEVGADDWFSPGCDHEYENGICIHCGAEEPVPAEDYTIYFDLGITPWEQVYIYWWRDNDNIGEWPGELMTHEGGSVYSVQLPENVNGLLFTNGDGDQTPDLALLGDGYIYSKASDEWTVHNGCAHEWDEGRVETEPTCTEYGYDIYTCLNCDETISVEFYPYGHDWVDDICSRCGWNQNDLCTVYFDMAFSNRLYVNIYWWADGEEGSSWPGTPMTYEGGSIYSAQIPSYATGLVFNDEGFKDSVGNSPDMELPGDGYVYREKFDQWVLHNGCNHEWDGGEVTERANCLENGLYAYTCGNCDDTVEVEIPAYSHSYVDGYCQTCGAQDPTQMYTVYYDIAFSERECVNIYWWADNESIGPWPGVEMTHEGGSIYSAQVPAYITGLLFNDGQTQTGDLTLPGDGYVYRESLNEWVLHNDCCHEWNNGVCDLCGEGETEEPDGMHTVYFDNTFAQFDQVYIVYFVDNKPHKEEMTHVDGNIYTAQIPEGVAVTFRNSAGNGLMETPAPGDDYLCVKDNIWIPYNGCIHEWNDGEVKTPCSCTEEGVYLYTCDLCGQNFEEKCGPMNHTVVGSACTECGATMGETVEVLLDVAGKNVEKVYVYWWGSEFKVASPGAQMRRVCATVYSVLIPADAKEILFDAGHVSSSVLAVPKGDNMFLWDKGDWGDRDIHFYVGAVCTLCGNISTGFVEKEDGWYYYENGVQSQDTGLVRDAYWCYIVNGKLADTTTTLVKYNNEWWYVVNGRVASDMTTLVKYNGEWWYVVKGKIASKTTTLVKYNNEWWYVVKGKIASKTTTLVKYNNEWWYVVKGKIASKTTTLVQYNGGWYYLVKGKLAAKTTTLVKYNGAWYYVEAGKVNFAYTGNFLFNGSTYRIVKGKVA